MLFIFGVIFMLGSVVAVWSIYHETISGYVISGGSGDIIFVDQFSVENIVSPTDFVRDFKEISFENIGLTSQFLLIELNISIEDVADFCEQKSNGGDVEFYLRHDIEVGQQIENGEIIEVLPGQIKTLILQQVVAPRSCPGTYLFNLKVTEAL